MSKPTSWIATGPSGRVLHFSVHDGWTVQVVTESAPVPAPPAEPTDDYIFAVAQELVRVACERVCDDVTALARDRGSDPECKSQSYWAGHENACEEVKHRIGEIVIPLLPNAALTPEAPQAEPTRESWIPVAATWMPPPAEQTAAPAEAPQGDARDFETWWARNHPFDWWASERQDGSLSTADRLRVWGIARRAWNAAIAASRERERANEANARRYAFIRACRSDEWERLTHYTADALDEQIDRALASPDSAAEQGGAG